jgi:hypothetical protein
MSGDYLERQSEQAQNVTESFAGGAAHANARGRGWIFFRAVSSLFCGVWFALLLLVWPSSDWIGLLVLSQALLAAAYLLKSSSTGSGKASPEGGLISLAQGEDHAH